MPKNSKETLEEWVKARKRFQLSHAQVQMARELGLNPRKLGGKANHRQESGKAPVPQFIENCYVKRFGKQRPDKVQSIEDRTRELAAKKAAKRALKKGRQLAANESKESKLHKVETLIAETMVAYDPDTVPDPDAWLESDEQERLQIIEAYHLEAGIELPNLMLHCAVHAIVENQLAGGEPAGVRLTLRRLMREGLDRHDALHAVGFVLGQLLYELVDKATPSEDPNLIYERDLEQLTAKGWRAG